MSTVAHRWQSWNNEEEASRRRGKCVKPQPVLESSIVSSVAELVHDILPTQNIPSNLIETVEWVEIKHCSRSGKNGDDIVLDAVIIGLSRGYQIWVVLENGDCEEALSVRQTPLRCAEIVSDPRSEKIDEVDLFRLQRPLIALVDDSSLNGPNRHFCTMQLLSLKSSSIVHTLDFADPIVNIVSSVRCLVVGFTNYLIVCDAFSLVELHHLRTCQISADGGAIFALSDRLLAFADCTLAVSMQSCGGMWPDESALPSYASQMMSVAKNLGKTVSAFGESMVSGMSTSPHNRSLLSCIPNPGIVSVLDVDRLAPVVNSSQDKGAANVLLLHFVAHDQPVSFLRFGEGGFILLTAAVSANSFNVFNLLPHPVSSSLSAVQHMYTLFRGSTPARVLDCSFSTDNRWVALSTNHGTTHVFAISPYGGPVTMRTHGGKIVNRESRFQRSAGISDSTEPMWTASSSVPVKNQALSSPQINRPLLARAIANPRIGPFAAPVVMQAVVKIRQRFLSADNLSAWATDLTSGTGGGSRRNVSGGGERHRLAVSFATVALGSEGCEGLFVVGSDGLLTQYELVVKQSQTGHNGKTSNASPIAVSLNAVAQWNIHRTRICVDVLPPLSPNNPLMASIDGQEMNGDTTEDNWMTQLEVLTHSGPHRRLWMGENINFPIDPAGPQFAFRTFVDSGHASADLVSPASTKSVPVVIERSPAFPLSEQTRIVCGSWSSDNEYKSCDEQEFAVRDRLAEAMQETNNLNEPRGSETSSESSSSPGRRSRDRDSLSLQFANIDV